ncbi:unnamed protein product [Ranitomeya imitator]|uniref:Uncharacterized protein n=1 Tax=Ranitomeya imitator TaxID=111125 RepID=A0ABN9LA37_9NEOB|nr:unnamed protein product [Ranitomeya imitator]
METLLLFSRRRKKQSQSRTRGTEKGSREDEAGGEHDGQRSRRRPAVEHKNPEENHAAEIRIGRERGSTDQTRSETKNDRPKAVEADGVERKSTTFHRSPSPSNI